MTMRYIKVFFCFVIVMLAILLSLNNYYASEKDIEVSKSFTSESENPTYNEFEKIITKNGVDYELKSVDYEKIDTEKKTEKRDKTTTVVKENLRSKSYSVDSNASYYHEKINVDGKDYNCTLVDVTYENHTKTNRHGEVSGSTDYGLRTTKPNPPSTKSLSYYDSDTGQTYNVDAPLTELKTTETKWQDYTYINLVFSNYTDTQFMFNDKVIKNDGNTVLGSNYYDELLSMAGLSGDNYKIKSVYWTSDAYMNGNVKYRNARADIQAYSCAYKAHYYLNFSLPDVPSYTAKLKYKYSEENVIKTIYKYKAKAKYRLIEEGTTVAATQPTTEPPKKAEITVKTVTTISLIFAISLAFVLLIFFLITRIKKENKFLSKLLNKKH